MRLPLGLGLTLGAVLLQFSLPARAGTLTLSTGPTTTLVNVTNTSVNPPKIIFQVTSVPFQSGNSLKLFGDQIFTNSSTANSTVTISLTGTGTANSGDFFSIGYKFSLTLTGTGTVTPTLNVNGTIASAIPIPYSAATTLTPATSGTTSYLGTTSSATSPFTASATVNASASFSWIGGTVGNTLEINIPSNSIDFAVGTVAVPEPSSWALLLMSAPLAFLCRSRFLVKS